MKYLKPYKIFESAYIDSSEKSEALDILQELVDDGFSVDVQHRVGKGEIENSINEEILVTIYRKETFSYKLIEEYILRLIEFLERSGFKLCGQSNPLVLKNVAYSSIIPHSAYYHKINFGKKTII